MNRLNFIVLIVMLFIGNLFSELAAQNDSIVFTNDNYMVGEIKNLNQGVIQVETHFSDSDFKIWWDKIKYNKSDQVFFVSASSGERYNGGIRTVEGGPAKLIVNDIKDGEVTVDAIDIVYLKSVDQTFISRLDLLLSIGYTLTKENNNHQFSSRINIDYMANTFAFNGYYSMVHNYQTIDTVKTTTKRTEGGIGLQFFIIRDWFATVSSNLLQSSEQKLNLRAVTKGGIGNYMVKNYKMFF